MEFALTNEEILNFENIMLREENMRLKKELMSSSEVIINNEKLSAINALCKKHGLDPSKYTTSINTKTGLASFKERGQT